MKNILYKNDRIVLLAHYDDPKPHRHFSKHILMSQEPFLCQINGKESFVNSALIQSGALHHVTRNTEVPMVVFLIDETSTLSKILDEKYFFKSASCSLPSTLEEEMRQMLKDNHSLYEIDEWMMQALLKDTKCDHLIDPRVAQSIQWIDESESIDRHFYEWIPQNLFLSKSRFLHLFKSEVGIDLKNYLLLKKFEKTYRYVVERGMSITNAAIIAGFSSSSHFATACKKHYGISFTDFLKSQDKDSV